MGRFVLRRAVRGIVTLWLVVSAVFVVLRLSGDPALAMLGPDATPVALAAFRARHGLDAPIPVQYARYVTNVARGDFGDSLNGRRPALDLFRLRLGATLELGFAALAIALLVGIPVGVLAAIHRGSVWDRLSMIGAFVGQSAPNFFVGIVLILLLSLRLKLLPSSGRGEWSQLVMPAATLATGLLATMARMSRSALLEVLADDYVRTARAKGLAEHRVIVGHTLRNAAIPVVTLLGLWIGALIGGTAITETVFAWPGVGRLAVEAVANRDYPVIQLVVIVVAATVVAVNLLVDIAYGLLDPRIAITPGAGLAA